MSIIDMHVHLKLRSRCSNLGADDIDENISNLYTGVCLTDHWLLKARQVNPFTNGLKVFYGAEVSCKMGDILAYGVHMIPIKKTHYEADYILNYIHGQGGLAVCAHPYSNRHSGFGDSVFDYDFDAIELNGSLDEEYLEKAEKAANEMDIPLIGGSDAHSIRQLNTIATKFDKIINSMNDIVKAIKNRECEPIKIYYKRLY